MCLVPNSKKCARQPVSLPGPTKTYLVPSRRRTPVTRMSSRMWVCCLVLTFTRLRISSAITSPAALKPRFSTRSAALPNLTRMAVRISSIPSSLIPVATVFHLHRHQVGFRPVAMHVIQNGINLISHAVTQYAHPRLDALAIADTEQHGLFVLASSGGEKFPSAQRSSGSPYGSYVFPIWWVRERVTSVVLGSAWAFDGDALAH